MRTSAAGAGRGAGTSPPARVPRGTGRTSEGPRWCRFTVVPSRQQGRRRHMVTAAAIACLDVAVPPAGGAGMSVVPWGRRAPGGLRASPTQRQPGAPGAPPSRGARGLPQPWSWSLCCGNLSSSTGSAVLPQQTQALVSQAEMKINSSEGSFNFLYSSENKCDFPATRPCKFPSL